MILDTPTKSLRIVLGEAKGTLDCDVVSCWGAQTSTGFQPAANDLVSNGTTAITVVPAPGPGEQRQVNEVRLFNNDTITHNVTLQFDNGGTIRVIEAASVAAGAEFLYTPSSTNGGNAGGGGEWNAGTVNAISSNLTIRAGSTLDLANSISISGTVSAADAAISGNGTVTLLLSAGTIQVGSSTPFSAFSTHFSVTSSTLDVVGFGTGSVTSVVTNASPFLNAGTITTAGTITAATIAASSVIANATSAGAVPTAVPIGSGLSFSGGTLSATGSGGTVTNIATSGAGITGGPITATGTLAVEWNAGTVSALNASQLALSSGTLQFITGPTIQATPSSAATIINSNTNTAYPALGAGSLLALIGKDSTTSGAEIVAVAGTLTGTSGNPTFIMGRLNGSLSSPGTLSANDRIASFGIRGYDGTTYASTTSAWDVLANQVWSGTAHGTYQRWQNMLNGATVATEAMRLTGGHLLIGSTTDDGTNTLQVNGSGRIINTGTVGTLVVGSSGAFSVFGTGLSISGGTLSATGGSGVTSVATSGAGISGGPITTTGTLTVEWNAGTVATIGNGLALSSSTLSAIVNATPTVISTSGSVVVPAGCNHCDAQLWGGGGGSGATTGTVISCGSNGGGGGYNRSYLAVTPGSTLTVTVGTLGAGGLSSGAAPTSGGDTVFQGQTAFGGAAGVNATTVNGTPGGTGGTATGSSMYERYPGQNGGTSWAQTVGNVIMGGGGSWSFPPVLPNGNDSVGVNAAYPGCAGAPANSVSGSNYNGGSGGAGQAILRFVA